MTWFYKTTLAVILLSSLLLTGCGEDSTDACVFGVQQNLDKGDYDSVIATLENNATCDGALTSETAWLNLASAYMGKSGLTTSNLLGAVLDSSGTSAMSSFMTSFAASATAEGLSNLKKASAVYAYLDTTVCDGNETGDQAEACLFDGLTSLTTAVGSLSAVVGSETLALLESGVTTGDANDLNSNGTADQLEITACAIADALNGSCTIATVSANLATPTFNFTSGNFGPYTSRDYNISTNHAYKLISGTSVLTTEGACDTTGTTCSPLDGTTCFPCPVALEGNTTTVTSGLIDIINNGGLDSLSAFLPADGGVDANITADLINSIETAAGINSDGTITEDEISAFLLTL